MTPKIFMSQPWKLNMLPYMAKRTLQINYPGLSGWVQCNHKSPYKREAFAQRYKEMLHSQL